MANMVDDRAPGLSIGDALRLAAGMAEGHRHYSGTAAGTAHVHISASGAVAVTSTVAGSAEVHIRASDSAGITDTTVVEALRSTTWRVEEVAPLRAWVRSLSTVELLVIFAYLNERMIEVLKDPEESFYGTIMTLPLLAVVLIAYKERRKR